MACERVASGRVRVPPQRGRACIHSRSSLPTRVRPLRIPVYSNVTAAPHVPAAIAGQLGEQLIRPVRFAEMIEAMHADGARIFVEVGPGSALTSLVGSILGPKAHLAVALDSNSRNSLRKLLLSLGRLVVAGMPVRIERLTADRGPKRLDPESLTSDRDPAKLPPSAWLVNGSRARPASGPEPNRLGMERALPLPALNSHKDGPSTNGLHEPAVPIVPRASTDASRPRISTPIDALPEADRVLAAYQRSMRQFLEVQRETMLVPVGPRATTLEAPASPPERNGHASAGHASGTGWRDPIPPAPKAPDSRLLTLNRLQNSLLPTCCRSDSGERDGPGHVPCSRPIVTRGRAGSWRSSAIVSGYPAEMVRLDLDLEADLGIDSIKRVEILGSLRDHLPAPADSETMDQLRGRKPSARDRGPTLPSLRLATQAARTNRMGRFAAGTAANHAPIALPPAGGVRRRSLKSCRPPSTLTERPVPRRDGVLLVTDDGRGVAEPG